MSVRFTPILTGLSLSARRAWIEICTAEADITLIGVALRKESVDRNLVAVGSLITLGVALRKESVDRNLAVWAVEHAYQVALRKESVDRNHVVLVVPSGCWRRSPQGERG